MPAVDGIAAGVGWRNTWQADSQKSAARLRKMDRQVNTQARKTSCSGKVTVRGHSQLENLSVFPIKSEFWPIQRDKRLEKNRSQWRGMSRSRDVPGKPQQTPARLYWRRMLASPILEQAGEVLISEIELLHLTTAQGFIQVSY
jgi:hypothetical protein